MLTIEIDHFRLALFQIKIMKTTNIDAVQIRCGSGPTEGVNTTVFAEIMRGLSGSEFVDLQTILTRDEGELLWRDAVVQRPFPGADAAIALHDLVQVGINLEHYGTAVATALIFLYRAAGHVKARVSGSVC